MKTVHKFELETLGNITKVVTFANSKTLSAGIQNGLIHVWVEVDTRTRGVEQKSYLVVGTGHKIPDKLERVFINTIVTGSLVFHVYEVK